MKSLKIFKERCSTTIIGLPIRDEGIVCSCVRMQVNIKLVINQYIERSWLPEDGIFLDKFPELKLQERESTRYYYKELQKAQQNKNQSGNSKLLFDAIASKQGSFTDLNGNTTNLPGHEIAEIISKLDDASKNLLEAQTKHIVQQVADQVQKSRGVVPGEFVEILKRLAYIEPPKFDWKSYIRKFVGRSTKTYTRLSRRKKSKRIPDSPGIKLLKRKHILAGVDTSGSVSTEELQEFLQEMHHLVKTGSDVTLCLFDTQIRSIEKFKPNTDVTIVGRGGTDFNHVADYYIENMNKYSCLMVFTDGEAPAPENSRGYMLWVHSSKSNINESLPGERIKLEL